MINHENINGVNGSGTNVEGRLPGRCSVEQQRRPGRNPATANAKVEWKKEINENYPPCTEVCILSQMLIDFIGKEMEDEVCRALKKLSRERKRI